MPEVIRPERAGERWECVRFELCVECPPVEGAEAAAEWREECPAGTIVPKSWVYSAPGCPSASEAGGRGSTPTPVSR